MGLFSANKSKDQLLIESMGCFTNKNYSKAKSLLNEALSKARTANEQYPILHLLGTCLLNLKDYKLALQYFYKALNSADAIDKEILKDTYYLIGVADYYLSEYSNSIDYFSKYIDINPKLIMAYRLRGECYQKVNKFQNSISDLEFYLGDTSKIEKNEENYKPIIALSNSYLQTNEFIKGTILLLKASEIYPNDTFIKTTLRSLAQEYFRKDIDSDLHSLILKGKLYSQISFLLNSGGSKDLAERIQIKLINRFEEARNKKRILFEDDVFKIASIVSNDIFEMWENDIGSLNNIMKSYLTFELAKIICDYDFFKMEADEIHRKIFGNIIPAPSWDEDF